MKWHFITLSYLSKPNLTAYSFKLNDPLIDLLHLTFIPIITVNLIIKAETHLPKSLLYFRFPQETHFQYLRYSIYHARILKVSQKDNYSIL